jgi:hypothetical protein
MPRTFALLGLALGLGLAIAGCGGGGDGATALNAELVDPRNFQSVGSVTLTEEGDRTRVQLVTRGANPAAPAIRAGSCVELRPREYKLSPVKNGRSTTELDVPIEELQARQMKVTVSKRAATPHAITACARLPFEGPEAPFAIGDLSAGVENAGLVWLEEVAGKTKVGVILYRIEPGPEPVTLRQGGCTGQVQQELTPMRESESVSTVDAPLSEVADGNHSIVVGRSCAPSLKPS